MIDQWEPDDAGFWEGGGKRIARRNLALSIFAEHFGFSVWVLWTIVVINLGIVGITLSLAETFWITAIPNLIGRDRANRVAGGNRGQGRILLRLGAAAGRGEQRAGPLHGQESW